MTPPSMQHLAGSSNIQTNSLQGSQMQGAGVSIDSGLAISMQDTMKVNCFVLILRGIITIMKSMLEEKVERKRKARR